MKISVVIATYNNPGYLKKSLEGYLHQTRLPDEIVIADDGSGQDTRDVVIEFRGRASFPVLHAWHEKKGFRLAAIRNLATNTSTGEYIIHTDGDCIPSRHFVADHERLAKKRSFVQGKRILVQETAVSVITGSESFGELLKLWLAGGIKKFHLLFHVPGISVAKAHLKGIRGCNTAFFREDLFAVNGWDERYEGWGREDSDIALRLMRNGVARRDALCSAVVFHLYHQEQEKGALSRNDQLLEQAQSGPFFAEKGLVKKI